MKLKYKNKADIPEELAASFVEFEENGETVWVHTELADTLKDSFRTKGDLTQTKNQLNDLKTTVTTLQASLDEKKRGEQGEQGKYKEIAEDWERRYNTDISARDEKIEDLVNEGRQKTKGGTVAALSAKGTEETRGALSRLIAQDLGFNDEGELIVLDDQGKATSTTLEEYEAKLPEKYPALVAEVPSSGGDAKGSKGGSPGASKWADYSAAELSKIRQTNPSLYEKLKATR